MVKPLYKELGIMLKEIRTDRKITQQDVADKLGIARQNVGYWEKGIRTLDIDTFFVICDIYNVDPINVLVDLRKSVGQKQKNKTI